MLNSNQNRVFYESELNTIGQGSQNSIFPYFLNFGGRSTKSFFNDLVNEEDSNESATLKTLAKRISKQEAIEFVEHYLLLRETCIGGP